MRGLTLSHVVFINAGDVETVTPGLGPDTIMMRANNAHFNAVPRL